jgi:hypothetical protein
MLNQDWMIGINVRKYKMIFPRPKNFGLRIQSINQQNLNLDSI